MDGGLIGGAIGAASTADATGATALEAEYRALEYGRAGTPVDWNGPGGSHGEVDAGAALRVESQDCRQYTHTVYHRRPAPGRARHRLPQAGRKLADRRELGTALPCAAAR